MDGVVGAETVVVVIVGVVMLAPVMLCMLVLLECLLKKKHVSTESAETAVVLQVLFALLINLLNYPFALIWFCYV